VETRATTSKAATTRRHHERSAVIATSPEAVFARLDDQTRLAEHMEQPSMMMGGGRMTYDFDERRGQAVGSHIRMGGKAFGLELAVDEVVTERDAPRRKVWRTVGAPKLVIMGAYEMGFEITPLGSNANLRVWIDYEPLSRGPGRWVASLPEMYARWCVERMVEDAVTAFAPTPA
jgi:hypothetical protein